MSKPFFGDDDNDDFVDGEPSSFDEESLTALALRYAEVAGVHEPSERMRLVKALLNEMGA